jgi:hypothetical protein
VDDLTSPQGSVAVAVAALLLVLGFRLARPDRLREWLAVAAYAVALAAQLLGARGLLPGRTVAAGSALRIGGAVLLVVGLVLAGTSSRARRRAAMNAGLESVRGTGALDPVYAGLAVVLVGQLLRGPSVAGGVTVLAAVVVNGFVALTPLRASR